MTTTWNTQPSTAGVNIPLLSLDHVKYIDAYSASLANAVTAIGSTVTTLVIDDSDSVTANVTVPSTLTLWFMGQGKLTVSAGVTCTINGPIVAEPRQIFAGAGTVAFTSNRSLERIRPQWWGAVGDDSTDCYAAIQAALTAAGTAGGGKVLLGAGVFRLSDTLVINTKTVSLIGEGSDFTHDTGSIAGASRLAWHGSAGGVMLSVVPTEGVSAQALTGIEVDGIAFIGRSVAGVCLDVKSTRSSRFRIFGHNPTTAVLRTGVVTTLGEARDPQNNEFAIWGRISSGSAAGVLLTGDSTANTSMNWFPIIDIQWLDGVVLDIDNGDNNLFGMVRGVRFSGGTGSLVKFRAGASSTEVARYNTIQRLSGTSTADITAEGTSTDTAASHSNLIGYIDFGNGTSIPTIETGATLWYSSHRDVDHLHGLSKVAISDSITNADTQRANIGTQSAYIHNSSSNHVYLTNGTETWGININAATGNLRLTRVAGSGTVQFGTHTALGLETVSGYITITDSGGTTRKIAVVS